MMTITLAQAVPDTGERDGDSDFPSLARQHYDPVYRFILRQAPSPEDAADLTQEAFMRAQRYFDRYDPKRDFAPWIFTIARRTIADFYRQRRQQYELLEDAHADPTPNPREQLDGNEAAESVWDEARRLKPKHHQVLLLFYRENMTLKQTAEAMGLTQVHVKVLLFRARAALKSRLPANPALNEETSQ